MKDHSRADTQLAVSELTPVLDVRPTPEPHQERKVSLFSFLLGPALFALALLMPPLGATPPVGMRSLGIFLWVMSWWIMEPIPLPATSFLALALLVLCGVFSPEIAFGYWANWVNIFLLGAFVIGHAMNIHGLNRRFAYHMIALEFIGDSSWRLMVVLLSACALLSSVASNTVSTVVFISISLSLIKSLEINPRSRYSTALLIGVPWAASIGGEATPTGAATHLYTIGLLRDLNYRVGFVDWLMFGIPIALMALALMFIVIRLVFRPEFREVRISPSFGRERLRELGPIRKEEKVSAAVLLVALTLWMLPDLLPLVLEQNHPLVDWFQNRLSWAVTALLCALALFLIPVDWKERKFAMTWGDAVKGVEWGVLAIVAAALAIGSALSSPEVGIGNLFTKGFELFSEAGGGPAVLIAGSILLAGLLTNVTSNFATLSAFVPMMLSIATTAGSEMNPAAVALSLGLASAWAFALPSAVPYNAIAFASGHLRVSDMFKGGMILWLLCTLPTALGAYYFLNWIFPWPR